MSGGSDPSRWRHVYWSRRRGRRPRRSGRSPRSGRSERPRRGRCPLASSEAAGGGVASRIFGQSNSMSGLCSSIQRMASSSSAGRPTFTFGGVRNQYSTFCRARPWRPRNAWTSDVVSYPRLSRVNRRNGKAICASASALSFSPAWPAGAPRLSPASAQAWLSSRGPASARSSSRKPSSGPGYRPGRDRPERIAARRPPGDSCEFRPPGRGGRCRGALATSIIAEGTYR